MADLPRLQFLLDTHVLVWWYMAAPDLTPRHREILDAVEASGTRVAVSDISLWEIAKLMERGRLRLTASLDECLADIENDPAVELVPVTGRIAAESIRLGPTFPRDPADQLIGATARCHGLTLLTGNRFIRDSGVVAVG
jgi:PIN domain nuclease of toxin-antitoxin system